MFAYLGLTSWNSFCPNFTWFDVVELYQANLGLSVLRYKTLISQGTIISHESSHIFLSTESLCFIFSSISGSRKTPSKIWVGCPTGTLPEFCVSRWSGSVEAYHANFGVLRRLRSRFSGFKCLGSDHQTQQTSPPKVARSLVLNNKQENWALNATENEFLFARCKKMPTPVLQTACSDEFLESTEFFVQSYMTI